MDHQDNFFGDDITSKKSSAKIDDFSNLKNASLDFLSNERNETFEKFDAEKPKEVANDFLNFQDDVGEVKRTEPEIPKIEEKFHHDEADDDNANEPEPEIDFNALEDDYLHPYASSGLSKGVDQPQNDKFISSEDLLSDFKDPAPAPVPVEAPKVEEKVVEPPMPEKVEAPKPVAPVAVEKQPPVSAPVVIDEQPKAKPAPTPVKPPQTSVDTQIEAEKIFTNIGLG